MHQPPEPLLPDEPVLMPSLVRPCMMLLELVSTSLVLAFGSRTLMMPAILPRTVSLNTLRMPMAATTTMAMISTY